MPQNTPSAISLASDLARQFEGCHLEPYHDPVGFPTIGYGRLLSREKWGDLSQWAPITQEQAETMLASDLGRFDASVSRLCPVPLTPHQGAALIDFAFNCGSGNLEVSTLRKCVNRGDHDEAAEQFKRWVYAGGVKLRGLVRRRDAESELYLR